MSKKRSTKPGHGELVGTPGKRDMRHLCAGCERSLDKSEQVLYVEQEVGRLFCSEHCITEYFSPDVDRLEKQYLQGRPAGDLTEDENTDLSHLRWKVLESPQEVWMEKTVAGDHRYMFVSEYEFHGRPIWCVCVCLLLEGQPSFLYLSFVSATPELVETFKKGELLSQMEKSRQDRDLHSSASPYFGEEEEEEEEVGYELVDSDSDLVLESEDESDEDPQMDREAEAWTSEDMLRAQLIQERSPTDIPEDEFEQYEELMERTLENPDDVWSIRPKGANRKLYHFVRQFVSTEESVWYVVVARETGDDGSLEILDAFPTRELELVQKYRCGELEYGSEDLQASTVETRTLH